MTLGDLRRLLERVADQDDSVPIKVSVTIPGLTVDLGQFPTGPSPKPLVASGPAVAGRIGQTDGYMAGHGPAKFILIQGRAG